MACPPPTKISAAGLCDLPLCKEGLEYYDTAEERCVAAEEGMNAYEFSVTKSMVLNDGYWRTGPASTEIHGCPQEGACIGEAPPADGLQAVSQETPGFKCREGHMGPQCSVCEKKWFLDGLSLVVV